jgi:phospholipid/cholesterol/gamma-HCH transport system substrate-binding protein
MKPRYSETTVGLFVTAALVLLCGSILLLGGGFESLFTKRIEYIAKFDKIDGLVAGAKVSVGGFQIGSTKAVELDQESRKIIVTISIDKKYQDWIRRDATAEMQTQGVLGDKYISIQAGTLLEPVLEPGSEIQKGASRDFSQLISGSDRLISSLSTLTASLERILSKFETNNRADTFFQGMANTSKHLASATEKLDRELDQIQIKKTIATLNEILSKINSGKGTVGALINDPALYDDLKAVVGQVNQNRIMRNVLRQTINDAKEKEAEDKKK